MPASPAFSIRGLSFRYERRVAVRCGSLDIALGECVAFQGPNGSGKTTLLKLMNGLLGPFEGRMDFLGRPLARNPLLRARSVYVHQHPVLFAGTVADNLAYALTLRRVPRAEARRKALEAARRFRIDGLLEREAARLSGGETQRVAVARAVAAGADVILLDEPTSSMDAESGAAVRELLAELKAGGSTIVFSSHDGSLVREAADRLVLFDAGAALESGAPPAGDGRQGDPP